MTVRPTPRRTRSASITRSAALTVALLIAVLAGAAIPGGGPAGAAQGTGNPSLTVSPAALASDRATTVTVRGIDYLVPPHAPGASVFGGVYLFFGWVKPGPAWGPSFKTSTSNDGNFGYTYHHAGDGGDGSTRDDGTGRMRLVSFTAGGESGNATPFHMDDAGNWTTTLTVRGPTYVYQDPASGTSRTVDCRVVQCGVYTIGAHGKSSRTNEKFAPVTFTATPSPPVTAPPASRPPSTGPSVKSANAGAARAGAAAATLPEAGGDTTTTTSSARTGDDEPTKRNKQNGWGPAETPDDERRVLASGPAEGDGDGGTNPVPWIAATVVLAAAGGGTWFLRRRAAVGR